MSNPEYNQWSVKYRPKTFDQVLGNEGAIAKAKKIVEKRDTHAILMFGESGCAKTTLARIIANNLTEYSDDIIEENISNKNSIDDVRTWITQSGYMPRGKARLFILDEAHRMGKQAQSAILKELEEPKHNKVVWILCTDRPHMLDPQLANRLYKIQVEKPDETELAKHLYRILRKENALTQFNEKQRQRLCLEVVKATDRVPRAAIQLLKETADSGGDYESFKDLVIEGIRKQTDSSIDKVALQVIMALYSTKKPAAFRLQYLLTQLVDRDMWGLLTQLTTIHYALLNHVAGNPTHASRYFVRELSPQGAVPDAEQLPDMIYVAKTLSTMKNNLINVNGPVPQYVVPELADLVLEIDKRRA